MKHILIFGGTGFIGRNLICELKTEFVITVLSRNPEKHQNELPASIKLVALDFDHPENIFRVFEKADIIINLAGKSIGSGRWTKSFRKEVSLSRQSVNEMIESIFMEAKTKPALVIQASATGIYGSKISDEEITESSPLSDNGFLAEVALKQEKSLQSIENKTRLVFMRSGIILDKNEGALPRFVLPFRLYAGGWFGSGKQWISWIHIDDAARAIRFIIENKEIAGPVNLTAPHPVRQVNFAKILARTIQKPFWIHIPAFGLQMLLGKERAYSLLLDGLKIVPKKLTDKGFDFKFQHIESALFDIYR